MASVLELRHKRPTWGPKKIRAYLGRHRPGVRWPAESSIGELLQREGLVVSRRKRLRAPPRTAPFAACGGPNDVWCIDPLSDAYSRYLLRCQGLKQTDVAHAWPVLEAAFREYGLPSVLRSDNGPPFGSVGAGGLSPFAVKVVKAGVLPERIDPGQPQQNGRLERLHGTVVLETTSPAASSLRAQGRRFAIFRRDYNEERPHEALGQTPPADHYECSPRRYSGRLRSMALTMRCAECITAVRSVGGATASTSARAWRKSRWDHGDWDIHFGPVPLGRIDRKGRFHRPKRKRRRRKPVRG